MLRDLFYHSIRWKFLAVAVGIVVSVVAIMTVIHISAQEAALKNELNTYIETMKGAMKERANDLAYSLETMIEEALVTFNISGIINQIGKSVKAGKESGEPAYIILMDNSSTALIHTLKPELSQTRLTEAEDIFAITRQNKTINEFTKNDNEYMELIVPVYFASQPWGVLRIGYSNKRLNQLSKDTQDTIKVKTHGMIVRSVVVAIIFIMISSIIVWITSGAITDPLINLTGTAEEIAKGDFSAVDRITVGPGDRKERFRSKDEVGILARTFVEMTNKLRLSHEQLAQYNRTLEGRVEERTRELHEINKHLQNERNRLELAHKKITDSIEYASMIQNSLLPEDSSIAAYFSQHLVIWQPKDVVGGDIYIIDKLSEQDECIVSVIDCTGHGVPGAFVTMLVRTIWSNVVDTILSKDSGIAPGQILFMLNKSIRDLLKQDIFETLGDVKGQYRHSNVGFDGGVLYLNRKRGIVRYAGANVSLFVCRQGHVDIIKGDRQSVGYKDSNPDYIYRDIELNIVQGDIFYISTDGYLDQNGGNKDLPFGRRRFVSIIENNWHRPMSEQREALLDQLNSYQGLSDRNDDITVVGLTI
ncbi:MAG: SpoIIE family protein phosphatase [Nitrospirae bacterium]|uniref:SpoIIE family protein phosphatase n=1 Tax=Candidatus Magnetobacterium casense TaxID=1455061 RepID=UPI00058C1B15|nr:SpoIIE family protein phosphatase [Candidatus Magnetobacterium casensis]MBF0336667.1 SpoIIE family protein phosphatase [Nitrospirota bacterium]